MSKFLLLAVLALPVLAADVCNPRVFQGAYGFQLSGDTTISGDAKPVASVGRLVFDESGGVSGVSSAHFAGYLLGNPTTGSYEAHTDCTITWSLQDTSGAYQHFQGTMTPDARRVQFHQTDPGGPGRGLLVRTPQACGVTAMQSRYRFAISGSFTPMLPDQQAHKVSANGAAQVRDGGVLWLAFTGTPGVTEGTVEVDDDCVVQIEFTLASGDIMNLRGVLVDDGRQILAIQTDPGATVTATFTAQPVQNQ